MSTVRSARIGAFREAAGEDPVKAVEGLRTDLEAAGGPLVEPTGDHSTALVTFVWIGTDGPVSLKSPLLGGWDWSRISVPMTRVEGTDVWYLSALARSDISTTYQYMIDDPSLENDPWEGYDPVLGYDPAVAAARQHTLRQQLAEGASRSFADPFNPDRLLVESQPADRWQSILTLPDAEPLPWFDAPADKPGRLTEHKFASTMLGNERTVTVYTPPGYSLDGEEYPVVVMLDGELWTNAAQQYVAFDNLIATGRIPPLVVAFVNNAPSDWVPGVLRAYEMNCHPDFPTMLADELVPMLRKLYHVTSDPSRTVMAGQSFGGLAAAWVGLQRPEVFGNVLACSPAVWWGYATDTERFAFDEHGLPIWVKGEKEEPEWLVREYAAAERKPLRIWVDVGCLEVTPMMPSPAPGLDYRASVRHFRTVLIAKGYDVTFYEAPGGHDWPTFRRSQIKGLQTLLGPRQRGSSRE